MPGPVNIAWQEKINTYIAVTLEVEANTKQAQTLPVLWRKYRDEVFSDWGTPDMTSDAAGYLLLDMWVLA